MIFDSGRIFDAAGESRGFFDAPKAKKTLTKGIFRRRPIFVTPFIRFT